MDIQPIYRQRRQGFRNPQPAPGIVIEDDSKPPFQTLPSAEKSYWWGLTVKMCKQWHRGFAAPVRARQ